MLTVNFKTESRFEINREKIKEIIQKTLEAQGMKEEAEIDVTVVGDRKMKELNQEYLGHDETTDVLSFPLESDTGLSKRSTMDAPTGFVSPPDGILHLGDIVVSYPQAVMQAAEKNILVDEAINFLVEHGILRLLGIHHDDK